MFLFAEMKVKLGALIATLGCLVLGRWSPSLQILLFLMILDYLSGCLLAFKQQALSSRVGFKGISRKILMFILIGLGHQLDQLLSLNLLRDTCTLFYAINEALSILENATGLGLPLPRVLVETLANIRNVIDNN